MDDYSGSGVPYQAPLRSQNSNILILTNPSTVLGQYELMLRGLAQKESGGYRKVGEPLMNDLGINNVLGQIQSVVNQVYIMGNLSKQEIPNIMTYFSEALSKDLMMNRVDYHITDTTARTKIHTAAILMVFGTVKRAFEEGDRRFWGKTTQEIHSTVQSNTKKGGLFSAINPWK